MITLKSSLLTVVAAQFALPLSAFAQTPVNAQSSVPGESVIVHQNPAPLVNTDPPLGQVKYVRFELALQMCREAVDIQACVDKKTGQKSRGVVMPTGELGESTRHTSSGVSINGIFRTCSIKLVEGQKQKICQTQ